MTQTNLYKHLREEDEDNDISKVGEKMDTVLLDRLKYYKSLAECRNQKLHKSLDNEYHLELKLVELRTKYREIQGQYSDQVESAQQWKAWYDSKIEEHLTTIDSVKTQHSVNMKKLVKEKNSAEKKLSASRQSNTKQSAKHDEEVKILLNTISSLQTENSESSATVAKLRNEMAKTAEQLLLATTKFLKLPKVPAPPISKEQETPPLPECNLSTTMNELISSENMVPELLTKILDVLENKIDNYKENIRNLQTCVGKLKQQSVTNREHHESLILTLRSEISDLKKVEEEFDSLQTKFNELNQEFLPLKDQLDESCKVNGYLLLKLSGLENEFKLVLSANEHLKQSLQSMENSCSRLADKFCPVCLVSHAEHDLAGTALVALTACGHVMCSECLENQSRVKPVCPMCQANFTPDQRIKLFF
ncbi:hypothetical protein HDE_06491 [Halotydeus destructor]|nr:hypothetical protein HDE_06491 [Halotydeus destructor]